MTGARISLEDGKYVIDHDNGVLHCQRHGQPWPAFDSDLAFSGVVLALVQEVERLQALSASLLGMVAEISDALGIDEESQETANGAGEILERITEIKASASPQTSLRNFDMLLVEATPQQALSQHPSWESCKFASGGARCVSHCGAMDCLKIAPSTTLSLAQVKPVASQEVEACPKCNVHPQSPMGKLTTCFREDCPALAAAPASPQAPAPQPPVMSAMVDRFLCWKLPPDFAPDCGITFKRVYNETSPLGPQNHEPTGTNLLTADQARAMLEHVLGVTKHAQQGEQHGE